MNFWGWFGLILGLAGGALGIYAAINPMAIGNIFLQIDPNQIGLYMGIGMPIFFIVVFGAAFGPFVKNMISNSKKKKRLAQIGVKGTATILSVQDTGLTVNNNPYIKVTVQIKPGIQATFQTMSSRVFIPRPGDNIEVIYDPADPTVCMPVMN